jgi:hypothetical protein
VLFVEINFLARRCGREPILVLVVVLLVVVLRGGGALSVRRTDGLHAQAGIQERVHNSIKKTKIK